MYVWWFTDIMFGSPRDPLCASKKKVVFTPHWHMYYFSFAYQLPHNIPHAKIQTLRVYHPKSIYCTFDLVMCKYFFVHFLRKREMFSVFFHLSHSLSVPLVGVNKRRGNIVELRLNRILIIMIWGKSNACYFPNHQAHSRICFVYIWGRYIIHTHRKSNPY